MPTYRKNQGMPLKVKGNADWKGYNVVAFIRLFSLFKRDVFWISILNPADVTFNPGQCVDRFGCTTIFGDPQMCICIARK